MKFLSFRNAFVAALAVAGAAISAHSAALGYWRTQPAEAVPQLLAGDPTIRLGTLRQAAADGPQASYRPSAVADAAREALRRDPLDFQALASLGGALPAGDPTRGSAVIALAERVSRRDLATQFMLIEIAARKGTVPAVLTHYNRAMSVHPETATILAPVLARGLTEPEIRAGLVPYSGRLWFRLFIEGALASGAEPGALVALIGSVSSAMPRDQLRASASLLAGHLKNAGYLAELRPLVAALPSDLTGSSTRFGLPDTGEAPGLAILDWSFADDAQAQAAILPGSGLAIRIAPEQRRVAAQRITLLEPGRYELRHSVAAGGTAPLASLEWSVSCMGARTGQASVAPAERATPTSMQTLAISLPQDCPAQHWQLFATGARTQGPSRAELTNLSLRRIAD